MAKSKKKQPAKGAGKPHLNARISYLHRAAEYLARTSQTEPKQKPDSDQSQTTDAPSTGEIAGEPATYSEAELAHRQETNISPSQATLGSQRHLISHIRAVSLKGQTRLPRSVKHTLCKRCNALLVPGKTSSSKIENKSTAGRKPWANVHVVTCSYCNAQKRFPVGAARQKRKQDRQQHGANGDITSEANAEI